MDESWATLWEAVGDAMPDQVALSQGDHRLTWAELDDRAARLAAALAAFGVGEQSKVAILAYNVPEHLEAVFAAYKLRACPINLNFRYLVDELVEVLCDADAEVLVFSGILGERVAAARPRVSCLQAAVQLADGAELLEGALAYDDLVASHEPAPRLDRSGDDVQVLYTGGTTGSPRGVLYRHRGAVAMNAFAAYTLAGLETPEDAPAAADKAGELARLGLTPTVLPASPLVHGTALNLCAAAWLLGGRVVLLPSRSFDAHELWRVVEDEKVSEIGIVGDAFARPMVQALEQAEEVGRPYDISSVTRVLSSGAPWSPAWKEGLAVRGSSLTLVETIGSSEGGPTAVSVVPPGTLVEEARFVLGDRARLLAEDGRELEPGSGEVGLLAMLPPIPFAYYKDEQKSAKVFRTIDGQPYSITGDYARLEEDGSVVFLGRGSLCINTAGEKVFPEEVEDAIRTHPLVVDANIVGLPDEQWGQAVTAVVALDTAGRASEDDIRDTVRARLAGYKVPKHVVFVTDIPRSPSGKAQYHWARQVAEDALAARGASAD